MTLLWFNFVWVDLARSFRFMWPAIWKKCFKMVQCLKIHLIQKCSGWELEAPSQEIKSLQFLFVFGVGWGRENQSFSLCPQSIWGYSDSFWNIPLCSLSRCPAWCHFSYTYNSRQSLQCRGGAKLTLQHCIHSSSGAWNYPGNLHHQDFEVLPSCLIHMHKVIGN